MSLRDELLKAGLVSKDKAKQMDAQTRKQAHKAKKNKKVAATDAAHQARLQERRDAEARQRRERDRALNQFRDAERKHRARLAQGRQLIESNRLNEADAEIRYNFLAGNRFIRYVRVTPQQQKQLARGLIGVARNDRDKYDFPLIPRETALKLRELCPENLLLLNPESDADEDTLGQ